MQEENSSTNRSTKEYPNTYNYEYASPENENSSFESVLWHYLGIFRRRFWLIMPFVLIFLAIGIIQAIRKPEVFSSKAKLLVEKSTPNVMSFDTTSRYGVYDPAFIKTQPELLKSRVVMEIALENPTVKKIFCPPGKPVEKDEQPTSLGADIKKNLLALLGGEPARTPEPWELLSARINAVPEEESSVITIQVSSGIPEETALIANTAAEAFREYHLRLKLDVLNESAGSLIKEKNRQEKELLSAEKELQSFYETAEGISGENTQPASSKLASINSQRTAVQLSIIKYNAELDAMKQASNTNQAVSASAHNRIFAIPSVQNSASLNAVKKELEDARQELAILSDTYGINSPMIRSVEGKIDVLKNEFWTALNNLIVSHKQQILMLEKEDEILVKQYEEEKEVLLKISQEAFTLQRLKDAVSRHRMLYDSLAARTAQIDISTSLATTNVQIIEKASVPTSHVNMKRKETVLKFMLIGLIIGFGLAFLLESLDKTIKTPEDLLRSIDIPLLGFVPVMDSGQNQDDEPAGLKKKFRKRIDTLRQHVIGIKNQKRSRRQGKHISRHLWSIVHDALLKLGALTGSEYIPAASHYSQSRNSKHVDHFPPILTDAQSSIVEAYRNVRTNLLFSNVDKSRKTLTITSCGPKEGKTTTACNLALSIAMSRKKVLLIDADLHRPKIHSLLNIKKTKDTPGLTSILVGETPWKNTIKKVIHEDYMVGYLDVILAGPTSTHPAELLGSETMKGFLREARQEYDWIIMDTPPVLFVSDAIVLSSFSDGTIIVVRAGTVTKGLLTRTKNQLDNIKANVIGSILNNMIISKMGRYYSYYGYHGYSRYSKDYHKTYYGEEED